MRTVSRTAQLIILAILLSTGAYLYLTGTTGGGVLPTADRLPGGTAGQVADAFRDRQSGMVVETAGRVERLLSDDREGSRHQRFIVRVDGQMTVLVAHNIDLAPRVPLTVGDSVELRGEYEWNAQGGVIHWTHHDPDGRRPGGWVRFGERLYQ